MKTNNDKITIKEIWDLGYQGVTFTMTIGKRPCWKSCFKQTIWQLSLGLVQFQIHFYDRSAMLADFARLKGEDLDKSEECGE